MLRVAGAHEFGDVEQRVAAIDGGRTFFSDFNYKVVLQSEVAYILRREYKRIPDLVKVGA